jgi:hypothetical protein
MKHRVYLRLVSLHGRTMATPLSNKLLIDRRTHRLVDVNFGPEETRSTKEVAAWLGVSVQFLEIGRTRGYGPKFVRIPKRFVRYRAGDVLDWLNSRTHACTSEYAKGAVSHAASKEATGLGDGAHARTRDHRSSSTDQDSVDHVSGANASAVLRMVGDDTANLLQLENRRE